MNLSEEEPKAKRTALVVKEDQEILTWILAAKPLSCVMSTITSLIQITTLIITRHRAQNKNKNVICLIGAFFSLFKQM